MKKQVKTYKEFKSLNEYKNYNYDSLTEQELLEMANLGQNTTGFKNIIIWIGPNPGYHWKRIKISNIPNKISDKNCFTLTIPDFDIIGEVNTKLITNEKLDQIKKWINLNIAAINEYAEYKITTDEFINKLKKI